MVYNVNNEVECDYNCNCCDIAASCTDCVTTDSEDQDEKKQPEICK